MMATLITLDNARTARYEQTAAEGRRAEGAELKVLYVGVQADARRVPKVHQ